LTLDLVPQIDLDRAVVGRRVPAVELDRGRDPASARICFALAGSGSPNASLNESLWPGSAAGTVEYSGVTVSL
jgi:hypothetical protein